MAKPIRFNKPIRLKKHADSYLYQGRVRYLITRDMSDERKNAHFVWIITEADPVTIGRGVDLPYARELIAEYEAYFEYKNSLGSRREAIVASIARSGQEQQYDEK